MADEVVNIVDPDSGPGTDYTSLSSWQAGEQGDLTGVRDEIAVATCRSTSGSALGGVYINGWTTSSTQYIKIWTDPEESHRHSGKWDTSKARMTSTSTSTIQANEEHLHIIGMQVEQTSNSDYRSCLRIDTLSSVGGIIVDKCIFKLDGTGDSTAGILVNTAAVSGSTFDVVNSILVGNSSAGTGASAINWASSSNWTKTVYNCTVHEWTRGLEVNDGTTVKNTVVFDTDDDFFGLGGTYTIDSCASDDGDGTNSVSPSGSDWDNEFTDYSNGDFSILNTGNLYHGSDVTNADDSDVPTDDIIGTARNTAAGTSTSIGAFEYASSGSTYTLTADGGSMTLTGTAVDLLYNRVLDTEAGAMTLTGTDAGLLYNRVLSAESGSIALTGAEVDLLFNRLLSAEAGSYAVSGQDIDLLYNRRLIAEGGAVTLTGYDVTLTYSGAGEPTYTLTAESGSVAITGSDVSLLFNRVLSVEPGAIGLTGGDVSLFFNRLLAAESGSIALTGDDASLIYNRVLSAESGSIALTGADVGLVYSGITLPVGAVTVTISVSKPGINMAALKPSATITIN